MKTNIFIALVLSFLLISVASLAQKERRQVDGFDEVSMGIAGDLYLRQGSATTLELEGDSDDLEDIITEVKSGKLIIRYKKNIGWNLRRERVTLYLTMSEVSSVSLGGSGKIIGENIIESDDLYLSVSGSGRINLALEADEVTQRISGSGNIEVSGEADHADISISGSGNLDALDLEVDHCVVKISGSGRCKITVGDSLEANISGSGSVYYKGNPDRIRSNVSGSGKVKPY
jgi:hypothetical protein